MADELLSLMFEQMHKMLDQLHASVNSGEYELAKKLSRNLATALKYIGAKYVG